MTQCQTGPMCDNSKRLKIYLKTDVFAGFANFGSCSLLPHPTGCKYSPKLPIQALFKLLSVEILALSVTEMCQIDQNGTVHPMGDNGQLAPPQPRDKTYRLYSTVAIIPVKVIDPCWVLWAFVALFALECLESL